MLKHIISYEWKMLLRQPENYVIAVTFFLLMCLSMSQGAHYFTEIRQSIDKLLLAEQQQRSEVLAHLEAIERGGEEPPEERNPQMPYELGGRQIVPHVVKTPQPLAPLSIGHSELFAYAYPISVSNGQLFAPMMEDFNLTHPIRHLFSWMDPAFVLIWLLPFWVIVMTYRIQSGEREQGTLSMIQSQPIASSRLFLSKLLFRGSIITISAYLFVLLSAVIFQVPLWQSPIVMIQLLGLIGGYTLFWCLLALLINTLGQSSAVNAGLLFTGWLLFVIVIPASLHLVADQSFPLPSRMNLVHEMRETELEMSLKINQEMNSFYLAHPELAPDDDTQKMPYWHYQVALQRRKAWDIHQPIVEQYYQQSAARIQWLEKRQFVSPAIMLQRAMNLIAGNAHEDFLALQSQTDIANEIWMDFFFKKIFTDEWVTADEVAQLPVFAEDLPVLDRSSQQVDLTRSP